MKAARFEDDRVLIGRHCLNRTKARRSRYAEKEIDAKAQELSHSGNQGVLEKSELEWNQK